MKKVLVNIPERKYVPTLGMGPHRMVYLRSDLVRPLRAYGLIIQVLKEERRKLHVDVPTERKVDAAEVVSQPTTVSAQPATTAPPVQPTFETPKTDVPVNNTSEFAGGVNGTEAAVSETEEAHTPVVEEKHEEAPVASQPEVAPTVTEPAHTEEQPQPTAVEGVSSTPVTEEHHEEVPTPAVSQPETVVEAPKTETTPEVAHVEETTAPVSQPETVVEAPKTETTPEVAHVEETTAPVSQPVVEEHHEEVPTPTVEEKHEEASPVTEPTHTTEEVPSPAVETNHVEETHTEEQPQPVFEEKHEEAPVASQPEVAPTATEENTPVEETNEVPDTEVTTEPVAAAGTYSTTTGRTIEISEEEYALLSREGVTKQELKDLLNAKGFRTLYRDTLKDLFAKFGIEY